MVVNAGLTPVLVVVPALGVSVTARELSEGVSAISKGVAGVAFFGGLPRFLPPTGRLLVISFLGGIILEEMKGNMGEFHPLNWLSLADDLKGLGYRAVTISPDRHYSGVGFVRVAGLTVCRGWGEVV